MRNLLYSSSLSIVSFSTLQDSGVKVDSQIMGAVVRVGVPVLFAVVIVLLIVRDVVLVGL